MSSLAELPELVGFFSYSRRDDENSRGALSRLRGHIQSELRLQLGRDFRLWQDTAAIPDGSLWEKEIERAIAESVFFIPIVTPSAIGSKHCQFEFESFLGREAALGRSNLIFPLLYIRVPALEREDVWRQNNLLKIIGTRQYVDWQRLRHLDPTLAEVGIAVERFCSNISAALHAPWLSPDEQRERTAAAARDAAERQRREAEERQRVEAEELRRREQLRARQRAEDEERRPTADELIAQLLRRDATNPEQPKAPPRVDAPSDLLAAIRARAPGTTGRVTPNTARGLGTYVPIALRFCGLFNIAVAVILIVLLPNGPNMWLVICSWFVLGLLSLTIALPGLARWRHVRLFGSAVCVLGIANGMLWFFIPFIDPASKLYLNFLVGSHGATLIGYLPGLLYFWRHRTPVSATASKSSAEP